MSYYTLVPALPALVPLARLQELPCSTLKLEQRLTMLNEADRDQLSRALHLCQRERIGDETLSDADEIARWHAELEAIEDPALRDVIAEYLQSRTLVAALRYRLSGQQEGASFKGFGPCVWLIRRDWQQPLFGLERRFPWLVKARDALEARQSCTLELMLLERFWNRLWRLEQEQAFSFAAVAAYRLRWALAEYRLRWSAEQAQTYFDRWVGGTLETVDLQLAGQQWTGSEA
ncbi:V-type ATP synthase subunit C [Marinobacterium lacunae]|uniref:V-type ATP synthase subunit C n=1 Tax=Marinobacterium lacunae TaxID=1232683 RepID=A0A081G2G0_9GAMM|nr:hypothetical protein [Marinobacterium lacunae]KEA64965.1 V-type ATP synthase subunit C [Marinobacterium lacunae]MBR9883580.1 hypothetical protein [Oceanospirillales bacterium]